MAKTAQPVAVDRVKEKPRAHLEFPLEDSKVRPTGLETATLNDTVTVTITGKLTEISQNNSDWNKGIRIGLVIEKAQVRGPAKPTSLADAMEASEVVR